MPRPPSCLTSPNLAGCRACRSSRSGVEPPRRALSEIEEEVVHQKEPVEGDHVVRISVRAASRRELHLVDAIEIGAEGDKFLFRVKEKNLTGNPLTIIEADHLDLKIVGVDRREITPVEIEISVTIMRSEAGRFLVA